MSGIKPKNIAIAVIGVIVLFIVIFFVVGGMSPTLLQASYQISNGNNCSLVSGVIYEEARNICINPSNIDINWTPSSETLPLANLFSPSGVILLIFMIALFVTMIVIAFKLFKRN